MTRVYGASALALLASAGPGLADVTPDQVWADMTRYMEAIGYTLSGTETRDGGDLTVTDVAMTVAETQTGGTMEARLGEIVLQDRGDGTVEVVFAERMPIDLTIVEAGETVEATIDYLQDGLEMVVSGEEGALDYDFVARSLTIALSRLVIEGETLPPEAANATVTMGPVESSTQVRYDSGRMTEQQSTLGDIAYSMGFIDSEGGGTAALRGTFAGVVYASSNAFPDGIDINDLSAALAAGLEVEGSMRHEGGTMDFTVEEEQGATRGQFGSEGGSVEIALSDEGMTYDIGVTGQSFFLGGPEIPLPINASIDEFGFRIAVPVEEAQEPQDAALRLRLGGLQLSDLIWGAFDPGQVLPRDPASALIDLSAQVTPFVSLFDADAMARMEMGDTVPGELNAMTLNALDLSVAGSRISGTGEFSFDNSDLETFDGMPRPAGRVDLQVEGHNALIDRLIQMGILAEEDAMGARMMLSMFTVPGSTPDEASATIEINEQGHILANGQRIQ